MNIFCYDGKNTAYIKIFEDINIKASEIFALPQNLEAEVDFVNSKIMRKINFTQRNIDKTTDVLSFPYLSIKDGKVDFTNHKQDINCETGNLMLGEILICIDVAKKQAKEYNHSLNREISYLYLHGLLHLLGFDHIDDNDKALMRKYEEEILNRLNITR